jgi:hypothetical protein
LAFILRPFRLRIGLLQATVWRTSMLGKTKGKKRTKAEQKKPERAERPRDKQQRKNQGASWAIRTKMTGC